MIRAVAGLLILFSLGPAAAAAPVQGGYITKKQYSKLPSKMLDGIIRHNKKNGKKPKKK